MTVTGRRPARNQDGPPPRPADGVLLQVPVRHGEDWAGFPSVPDGTDVSVSFSTPAAARAGATLEQLGYRTVGVPRMGSVQAPVADFVVSQAVIARHPHWWRSLAERSDRAFSLALGPVQAAFAEVLRSHQEPAS